MSLAAKIEEIVDAAIELRPDDPPGWPGLVRTHISSELVYNSAWKAWVFRDRCCTVPEIVNALWEIYTRRDDEVGTTGSADEGDARGVLRGNLRGNRNPLSAARMTHRRRKRRVSTSSSETESESDGEKSIRRGRSSSKKFRLRDLSGASGGSSAGRCRVLRSHVSQCPPPADLPLPVPSRSIEVQTDDTGEVYSARLDLLEARAEEQRRAADEQRRAAEMWRGRADISVQRRVLAEQQLETERARSQSGAASREQRIRRLDQMVSGEVRAIGDQPLMELSASMASRLSALVSEIARRQLVRAPPTVAEVAAETAAQTGTCFICAEDGVPVDERASLSSLFQACACAAWTCRGCARRLSACPVCRKPRRREDAIAIDISSSDVTDGDDNDISSSFSMSSSSSDDGESE
jgi:hypothetical protein